MYQNIGIEADISMRYLGQPNILLSLGQTLKYYLNQFGLREEPIIFILAILVHYIFWIWDLGQPNILVSLGQL